MQADIWASPSLMQKHDVSGRLPGNVLQMREIDALVLPASGNKPEIWGVTGFLTSESDSIVREHIDVRSFFPDGALSVLLCTVPSTNNPLPFAYRVFLDNYQGPKPLNGTIKTIFGRPWMGNVVVVKYSRTNTNNKRCFMHVQRAEAEFIITVLGDWISNMWSDLFDVAVLV